MHGVIDDGTLVRAQGLIDWLLEKKVRRLVPQVRTLEGTHILLQIVRLFVESGDVIAIFNRTMHCPLLHGHHSYYNKLQSTASRI